MSAAPGAVVAADAAPTGGADGAPAPASTPGGRLRRRWYRLVVPFIVFGLLVTVTLVARWSEDPRGADALSPIGTGPDGSSRLAELLAAEGVEIQRVTRLSDALLAIEGPPAVVFIPRSGRAERVLAEEAMSENHRVVMVEPSDADLAWALVERADRRWASKAVEPGCTVPEAVAAGRATVLRSRYASPSTRRCYDGGLVFVRTGTGELVVVGASDPFRNRRIDEHGNATLAVELLSAYHRVIWADGLEVDFDETPLPPRPPERPDIRAPDRYRPEASGFSGVFAGYPTAAVAGLALAALLAVLVALARGRRLGPPVGEPLPVVVPASETVVGRGRLYRTARDRGGVVTVLREAAVRRMAPALGLASSPPPDPGRVVAAVAERTGWPADMVHDVLYGPPPEKDRDVAEVVAALDSLVETVTGIRPRSGGDTA